MSSATVECNVCAEDCRHVISCPYCKYDSCVNCTKTFLLSKTQAQCMACKANWNNNFLRTYLPIDWIEKEYKTHVKSILFDREKNFMQETSDYLINYKRYRELKDQIVDYQNQISDMKVKIHEIELEYYNLLRDLGISKLQKAKNAQDRKNETHWLDSRQKIYAKYGDMNTKDPVVLVQQHLELEAVNLEYHRKSKEINERHNVPVLDYPDIYYELNHQVDILKNYISEYNNLAATVYQTQTKTSQETSFRSACNVKDCKGFLDKNLRCNVCLTAFCKDCKEAAKDNHTCNPDILASLRLLKNEDNVKPCPECGVGINKLEGCDHMWCLMCKTGFNWRTGKKIDDANNTNGEMVKFYRTKNIYHPVYNPQAPRPDAQNTTQNCNDRRTYYDFITILRDRLKNKNIIQKVQKARQNNTPCPEVDFFDFIKDKWTTIEFACNLCVLLSDPQRYQIANPSEYNNSINHKLRLKYLNNEIDEKQFNIQAMRIFKRIEYDNEIYNFVNASYLYVNDWVITVYNAINLVNSDWEKALEELNKVDWKFTTSIVDQFNKNSAKTSKLFNYTVYKEIKVEFQTKRDDIGNAHLALRNWEPFFAHFSENHMSCYTDLNKVKLLYWIIKVRNSKI